MNHLLKPIQTTTMIKSIGSQPSGAKATVINQGKGTIFGSAYEGFKQASRTYGFYQDIKPYLPETYLDRYRYKPHKRISGYLGQTFHKKKTRYGSNYKFNKKHKISCVWTHWYGSGNRYC